MNMVRPHVCCVQIPAAMGAGFLDCGKDKPAMLSFQCERSLPEDTCHFVFKPWLIHQYGSSISIVTAINPSGFTAGKPCAIRRECDEISRREFHEWHGVPHLF
jgi:hypothetical protein